MKHSVGLFSVLIFILAIVHFPYTATTTQELNTIVTPSISSGTAYIPTQDQVHSVVWSPDGSMIAISGGIAGCDDVDTSQFAIRIFNASTEEIFKNLDGMTCTSTFLDWSPDRQKLASLNSAQAVVYIWDISAENVIRTVPFETQGMLSAIWSPNGNLIASGFPDNGIVIWNPNTGERVNPVFGGTTFAWSPDSTQLVTGSFYNNTLHIQDVIAGSEVMSLTGASDVTNSVAWSPDGSRIASSSADHKIHIWNATNGQLLSTLNIPNTIDVQWSPDGQQIATAGFDADSNNGWISIWDANAGIELSRFSENERIYSVSWHPDGNQLVYVASGTVKIVPAPQLQTPAPSATIQSEAQTLRDLLSYPTCQRTCFMGIEPGVTTQTEVQKVFSDQNISYTVFAGIQDDREENGIYYGTGKRNIPFLSQHGGILESDVLFKDGIAGSIHLLMDIPISVILKAYGQPAIFTVDDGDYWLIYPAERLAFQVRDFISTENANLVFIMTDDVLLEAFINTPDLPVQDCPASTELCLIQTATPTP